jgi:ATP-dependent RNA helicase DOB1
MTQEKRNSLHSTLQIVEKRFPDGMYFPFICYIAHRLGIPLLDPVQDMHIEDETFNKLVRNIEAYEDKLLRYHSFPSYSIDG